MEKLRAAPSPAEWLKQGPGPHTAPCSAEISNTVVAIAYVSAPFHC